jgi:MptA/FolE2 family GTP cyclohydrolase
MSRFIELLERSSAPMDAVAFQSMVAGMIRRLDARSGNIEMRFPWFVRKTAPVSGVESLLDCDVCWQASIREHARPVFLMRVTVPVTSLCPCSKEISAYGAHNQRSLIAIEAEVAGDMAIDDLVGIAERSASCEIYGLLKRPDEKYVTERAYDNPRFVEDLVRDVATALSTDPRIRAYSVEAENFESIHNHSAFARVVGRPGTIPVRGAEARQAHADEHRG